MQALDNLNKIPMEVSLLLSRNKYLQQLLVDPSNVLNENAFNKLTVNELLEKEAISFTPVIDNNITNVHNSSFLIINIEEIDLVNRDENINARCAIWIGTDKQHNILSDNKIRTLELVKEIIKTLDGQKLSGAGVIEIDYATFTSYSPYVFGYKIVFNIKEQEIRKAEI